jgi:acetaldehyde dehydrogenase/alcohol dehydrogenase
MPTIAEHLELEGGNDDEKVDSLVAWVDGLKAALEIPPSIQAAGVSEKEFLAKLDAVAAEAFDDQCTGANPRYPLISEIRQLLLDSYYGRPYVEAYERRDEAGARGAGGVSLRPGLR